VRDLLARVLRVAILIIGLITALGTIGIDVTALVAGLGLTGFALGFALQDIIGNVLAGVLILMHRPFRRGIYIKVGDKEGTVIDMDLRYTSLQKDNLKILIPNSTLFKEAITIIMPTAPAPSMPPTNAP
jgi:small-conductance mechanosensitive channel